MKMRIKGDSLRLRVTRSEVARLFEGECLEETIHFASEAGAQFTYALRYEPFVREPTVHYAENRVAVLIPADQANTWIVTDQIGIAAEIKLGERGSLALLIEKDSPASIAAMKKMKTPS